MAGVNRSESPEKRCKAPAEVTAKIAGKIAGKITG
jgi:hypothetical protein